MLSPKSLLSAFSLLLTTSAVLAQSTYDCEQLRAENARLRYENASLRGSTAYPAPATNYPPPPPAPVYGSNPGWQGPGGFSGQAQQSQNVTYTVTKCERSATSNSVVVTLLLSASASNQAVKVLSAQAYDEAGKEYNSKSFDIGGSTRQNRLAAGVPTPLNIIFGPVDPHAQTLQVLRFVKSSMNGSPDATLEFRNLSITTASRY